SELNGDFSGIYSQDGSPIALYNPFDTYVDAATGRTLRRPFSNNQITLPINQFAKNITSYYPKPNVTGGLKTANRPPTNIKNVYPTASATFKIRNENLRIDQQIGNNVRIMFHRVFNPPPTACPNPYGTVASPVNCNTEEPIFLGGSVNWMINPHLVLTV